MTTPGPDLPLPEEPVELRARVRALVEREPERGAAVIDGAAWIAELDGVRVESLELERFALLGHSFGAIITTSRS